MLYTPTFFPNLMYYAIVYEPKHDQYEVRVDFKKPVSLMGIGEAGFKVVLEKSCHEDGFEALLDYIKEANNAKHFDEKELEKRLNKK